MQIGPHREWQKTRVSLVCFCLYNCGRFTFRALELNLLVLHQEDIHIPEMISPRKIFHPVEKRTQQQEEAKGEKLTRDVYNIQFIIPFLSCWTLVPADVSVAELHSRTHTTHTTTEPTTLVVPRENTAQCLAFCTPP